MRLLHLVIIAVLLLSGCTGRSGSSLDPYGDQVRTDLFTRYASGFRVRDQGSYTLIEVTDPWQQSKGVIFSYVLAPSLELLPDSLR